MSTKVYKIISGSAAEAFHLSRAKIRMYGGGFANGKTTALCADALKVARDYPGCNMLLGRASYPKLNSTLRREFFKWCPPAWIKSFNQKDNTCVLHNGTTIDFRYIEQRTGADGEQTSNLLSANYDYIGIDQIEDPEITEHDFEQLLGRLRGQTPYAGDDKTMPRTGPRFMALTCNPTLGWVYKRIVKPLHDFREGRANPNLIAEVGSDGNYVLHDGKPIPLVQVFEASTYENAQNLEADYIRTLEATYRGKMRDRYLLGKWVAFDGVVYDEFDDNTHVVPDSILRQHLTQLRMAGYKLTVLEGYDLGITEPSCYLLALVDAEGSIYIVDGFYSPLKEHDGIAWQANEIRRLREEHQAESITATLMPWADPAIFRNTSVGRVYTETAAEMFRQEGIIMQRANNSITKGIIKVKQFLYPRQTVVNPFTHAYGCPTIFISDKLHWMIEEFTTWRWKRGKDDNSVDETVDKDNHAMDALRYMLTDRITPALKVARAPRRVPAGVLKWAEQDRPTEEYNRSHRYNR